MTPDQYRQALAALSLTQQSAADLLGLDLRTSQRYASGASKIPRPVAILLQALVSGEISIKAIDAVSTA